MYILATGTVFRRHSRPALNYRVGSRRFPANRRHLRMHPTIPESMPAYAPEAASQGLRSRSYGRAVPRVVLARRRARDRKNILSRCAYIRSAIMRGISAHLGARHRAVPAIKKSLYTTQLYKGCAGQTAYPFMGILYVCPAIDGESRSPPLAWPLAL